MNAAKLAMQLLLQSLIILQGLGFGCCDNFKDKLLAAISQIISSLRDSLGVIQKFPVLCRAIAWDFEGVCMQGRKALVPKAAQPSGVWGHTPLENFYFRVSEMPFPSFSTGQFQ